MTFESINWEEVEQKAINVLYVFNKGWLMYRKYRMPDKSILVRYI